MINNNYIKLVHTQSLYQLLLQGSSKCVRSNLDVLKKRLVHRKNNDKAQELQAGIVTCRLCLASVLLNLKK